MKIEASYPPAVWTMAGLGNLKEQIRTFSDFALRYLGQIIFLDIYALIIRLVQIHCHSIWIPSVGHPGKSRRCSVWDCRTRWAVSCSWSHLLVVWYPGIRFWLLKIDWTVGNRRESGTHAPWPPWSRLPECAGCQWLPECSSTLVSVLPWKRRSGRIQRRGTPDSDPGSLLSTRNRKLSERVWEKSNARKSQLTDDGSVPFLSQP